MRSPLDRTRHIVILPSETEPGCYGWQINSADGCCVARAPYQFASRAAARLSAACWKNELDAAPAGPAHLRVLIADDNVFYAEALRCLLVRERHMVVGVTDRADDALTVAHAERPNLALVDLTLCDGCSGPELGRCLARDGVCVLFLTATPSLAPTDVPGVLGVLAKPAGDAQLLRAMAAAGKHIGGGQA